ncbi:MAG: RNA methyltransferase [Gammaproteobacteria bacterium]|nr:RNA methyltransferase [Gammaproteobacteria bacterium]
MTADVQKLLDKVRIVLIRTTETGNIGSAARAMKTMGLSQLVLVDPKEFPSAKATARASGADDLLANARVVDSLPQALEGCDLVMGTSARLRDLPWPLLDPREAAEKVLQYAHQPGDIAVVFGSERSGMSNEELDHCHFQVHIPANERYSSLNLAASVQVIAYELRMTLLSADGLDIEQDEEELAGRDAMERFYEHLFQVMQGVGYYRPEQPKLLRRRMKRLFNRPMMTHAEVQIMRGFLSMIEKYLPRS